MTSCKVMEEYTSMLLNKVYQGNTIADADIDADSDSDSDTELIDSLTYGLIDIDADIDADSDADTELIDSLTYGFIDADSILVLDSIEIALHERINAENLGEVIVEESDIMMGMIEDIADIPYFEQHKLESSSKSENIYNYPEGFVPTFPDSVYAERIENLRSQTTIELVFNNHVKSFIDVYAVKKRDHMCKILGLADIYFPMFEQALDKYDIPLEIKYLAVVESALNPRAGSHAGAKGLWQFMYATGKTYKLNVTSLVDDRMDPVKATEAACQHLLDLYNKYDDWFLALAAYNSGGGNVNKAIRRAGGLKNYWAIWPFLPKETRGYVPAFIAVNYVMSYSQEHNIYPTDPGIMADGVDSVTVRQPLHFDQLHEMLNIPMEDIKFFNPQYKASIIPANSKTHLSLRLPEIYIDSFIVHEKELYDFKTKKGIDRAKLEEEMKKVSDRSVHIVKSGESLGLIAKKYRISVNQLKTWNKLKSNTIYPGQKLIVYKSGAPVSQSNSTPTKSSSSGQKTHIVKSGDNLWDISKKYGVSIEQIKKLNGLTDKSVLKIGQKIIIRN